MKKKSLILLLILLILFVAATLPVINEIFDFTSDEGTPVTVTIPQGTAVNEIGEILIDYNLIKSK